MGSRNCMILVAMKLSVSKCKSAHFVFLYINEHMCTHTIQNTINIFISYIANNSNTINLSIEHVLNNFNDFRLRNKDSTGNQVYILFHKLLDGQPKSWFQMHLIC